MKSKGKDKWALAVSKVDQFHPAKTNTYSLYAAKFDNKAKTQMWSYNADKDTLTPHEYPKYVVTSGVKHNLYVFFDMGLMNQKFQVDLWKNSVYSEFTKR